MLFHIWELVLYCAGPLLKFVVHDTPTFTNNASSEPGLSNRKWPTCLGELEAQLKKLVGAFPITTHSLYNFISFCLDEQFRWADFSPVQYENWADGEPNGNASYSGCVRMYTSGGIEDGIWDDNFCDERAYNQFVCKTPKCRLLLFFSNFKICQSCLIECDR